MGKSGEGSDASALKEIVDAYNNMKNKDRELKDARGEALREAKDALGTLDESLTDASSAVDTPEAGEKLKTVVGYWAQYKDAKNDGKDATSTARKALEEADERLEKAIVDSRQGTLDVD